MIEVSNLSKSYGSLKAVDDISFSLKDGEILGFWVLTELVNQLQ